MIEQCAENKDVDAERDESLPALGPSDPADPIRFIAPTINTLAFFLIIRLAFLHFLFFFCLKNYYYYHQRDNVRPTQPLPPPHLFSDSPSHFPKGLSGRAAGCGPASRLVSASAPTGRRNHGRGVHRWRRRSSRPSACSLLSLLQGNDSSPPSPLPLFVFSPQWSTYYLTRSVLFCVFSCSRYT